ncbi:MAG: hypothetical protein M1334_03560 [Patescibacteria group bacterium]|nr:hypothetical protein [Patescibacteria group bacterium]
MTQKEKTRVELDKKFKKVLQTPASFDFFVAIHDFVQYIELHPSLSGGLSLRLKANQELGIPAKYGYLKQIYQGVEDINIKSDDDLGHARYAVIKDLNKIQEKDVSESNSFWKKRETSRKLTDEIYQRLIIRLPELKKIK